MKKRQNKEQKIIQYNNRSTKTSFQLISGLSRFYKPCGEQNLDMGDEGQSFQEFLNMKGIQPNEEGTGRISFNQIECVQVMLIRQQKNEDQKLRKMKNKTINNSVNKVKELISIYLNKPVQMTNFELKVDSNRIIDRQKNLQYSFKLNKKRLDALKILDLLTQYKQQFKLLVALIESNLHENGDDVYGRACGDGVAVIDLTQLESSEESNYNFYQTCIHETLHTLGFDHCLSWTCLMNPCIAGQMWLCPECIKKIASELDEMDIAKWAQKLQQFYKKWLSKRRSLLSKSNKIVQYLKNGQI